MLFEEGIRRQSLSVDGWLTKEAKEENNIGIEELSKDLMEDGLRAENRHNLSMDIYSENRRLKLKVNTD